MNIKLNKEALRTIIYYNWKRKLPYFECRNEMMETLGDNVVSLSLITKWYREFSYGKDDFKDAPRPGRPRTAKTEDNIDRVRKMINENNHITYQEMQATLNLGSAALHSILHESLKMRKVLSKWVPHSLTQEQKSQRVLICKQNLKLLNNGGHRLFSKIVTGDETYVHYYDPLSPKESRIWVAEDEPIPTLVRQRRAYGKILYAIFFRSTGLVASIKLTGQDTVTAKWYTEVCLPEVFAGVNINGLMLHHDNARPHTAKITTAFLSSKKVKIIPHPPYSPDLAMCDFWLFSGLKRYLRGNFFHSEMELEENVSNYLHAIPKEAWLEAFRKWKIRMERCVDIQGDYI